MVIWRGTKIAVFKKINIIWGGKHNSKQKQCAGSGNIKINNFTWYHIHICITERMIYFRCKNKASLPPLYCRFKSIKSTLSGIKIQYQIEINTIRYHTSTGHYYQYHALEPLAALMVTGDSDTIPDSGPSKWSPLWLCSIRIPAPVASLASSSCLCCHAFSRHNIQFLSPGSLGWPRVVASAKMFQVRCERLGDGIILILSILLGEMFQDGFC